MQPTSVALGGRRLAVGRPLMVSFTEQNEDAKKKQGSAGYLPPPKKRTGPSQFAALCEA